MADKVWIAESVTNYEGTTIIGVFSTKEKAIERCEKRAGIKLVFRKNEPYETFVCRLDEQEGYVEDYETDGYAVYEATIDEELDLEGGSLHDHS